MQGSKIRFSGAEIELFSNAEVILTKNTIIQKMVLLLAEVQESLLNEKSSVENIYSHPPKISKGENYLGLPYIILDYPRIARNNDLFFIRSMFWWGNFFSSTLQVSGSYKEVYRVKLQQAYEKLSAQHYYIGISNDPWIHHFSEDNYRQIGSLSQKAFETILEVTTHTKIAAQWPLPNWELAATRLTESWRLLMKLIT